MAAAVLPPPKSTFLRATAVGWTPMAVLVWRKPLDVAVCRLPNENKEDCSALSVLSLSKLSTNALTGAMKELSASNFLFRLSTKCSSRLFRHSADVSVIGDISVSVKWIHLGGFKRRHATRTSKASWPWLPVVKWIQCSCYQTAFAPHLLCTGQTCPRLLRHHCTAKWWYQASKSWSKCCVTVILMLVLPEMVFGDVPAWPLL